MFQKWIIIVGNYLPDFDIPPLDEASSTHEDILKENKQSQFLLSFTRFVSASKDPEKYIHQKISSMRNKDVNCLRILAILGKIEFSSDYILDKEILCNFDNLQKNCSSLIYVKIVNNVKYITYWHSTIGKYIHTLPPHLQRGLSNVQLFCKEKENYNIGITFWKQENFGKPSKELIRLVESVRSKECAKLINVMEQIEPLEDEETHVQLSKIHVLLALSESFRTDF